MKSLLATLCIALIAVNAQNQDYQINDIQVLNYALTLEHLEYAFYRDGLNIFDSNAFTNGGFNSTVYDYFTMIRGHEQNHVDTLTNVILQRSGTPVGECTYNFAPAYVSVAAFVATARILENTGVSAYDGAINRITELGLQTAAATIATVEARHASYLNLLNDINPFPSAFDNATEPAVIVQQVTPFINLTGCSAQSVSIISTLNPLVANFTQNAPVDATAATNNDLAVLKYALTLEYLEKTFYLEGLSNYSAEAFANEGYPPSVRAYIEQIAGHETTHVTALAQALQSNNALGTVNACQYNFPYTNVSSFLRIAAILENTGVSAYDGAVNAITDLTYRQIAATIATVEGRHAAYLNLISNYESPFPQTFDDALTRAEIFAAAGGFIQANSCPYSLDDTIFVPANFSAASNNPAPIVEVPTTTTSTTSGTSASTSNSVSTSTTTASSSTTASTTTGAASSIVSSVAFVVAIVAMIAL